MGPTPFYGGRAETLPPPKKNADFAMKQTNICLLIDDIKSTEFMVMPKYRMQITPILIPQDKFLAFSLNDRLAI